MNWRRGFCTAVLMICFGGTASASELVVNGDFSQGDSGFSSGYARVTQFDDTHAVYDILAVPNIPASQPEYGDWTHVPVDAYGNANGNVFVSDGPASGTPVAWSESVSVVPNSTYTFSFYGIEVSNNGTNALLEGTINGTSGGTNIAATDDLWQNNGAFTWNSGSNTVATLDIIDLTQSGAFNDFALDRISFDGPAPSATPLPPTWVMMLTALVGVGFMISRRKSKPLLMTA